MNIKAIAAAAAVLAAGLPAVANAQPTAPVSIVSQTIAPEVTDAAWYQQGFASYAFVNHSAVPATEVDLTLYGNGEPLATLRDVGMFSKGITIQRSIATEALARDQQLAVAEVKFADGSVWTNDEAAPHALRQTAVSFLSDF